MSETHSDRRNPWIVEPPLPMLVTGIAGVAGYNAFRTFRARFGNQVIGTRRVDNWPLSGDGIVPCNLHEKDAVKRLFDEYQFRSVLFCEGTCKLKSCELDPAMARRVNIGSVESVLDVIEGTDVRFVYLSIDLVFSGREQGGYTEEHPTDPVTVYGQTMAEAERLIMARNPNACILRISLPMGVSFNGHAGAIDWIQSRFKKRKPATLYFDEVRTPTYTDCMNDLFLNVLTNDLAGLYHAGGLRRLSLYQIAQIVNRVGGYDPRHLIGCPRFEAGPIPPRAGNVTLDSAKLRQALGYEPFDPWPFHDEYLPTHRNWHFERPAAQAGSAELLAAVLYRNPRLPQTEAATE